MTCSNGGFAGIANLYLGHEDLADLAGKLSGFPASHEDVRQVELGNFNPAFAGGGMKANFYCRDVKGHAVAEVELWSRPNGSFHEAVTLSIPIQAAGVDAFVAELMVIEDDHPSTAFLPMAK